MLGLIVVLVVVAMTLPASIITHFLPAQATAEDFSGTLWHGSAARLRIASREAGALEWHLHPAALLHLAVDADFHWVKGGFVIDGKAVLNQLGAEAHDLTGGGPIADLRDFGLGQGWRGTARLSLATIRSDFATVTAAQGKIEVFDIAFAQVARGSDLGSYVLQFGPSAVSRDGSISADLNDLGGPVEALAQIHYEPRTHLGLLSGTLKARAEAPDPLVRELDELSQLKPRDSLGRIPVDMEFTL
jgi:general secretion pathway protein N